jgi:hypothetical protein
MLLALLRATLPSNLVFFSSSLVPDAARDAHFHRDGESFQGFSDEESPFLQLTLGTQRREERFRGWGGMWGGVARLTPGSTSTLESQTCLERSPVTRYSSGRSLCWPGGVVRGRSRGRRQPLFLLSRRRRKNRDFLFWATLIFLFPPVLPVCRFSSFLSAATRSQDSDYAC